MLPSLPNQGGSDEVGIRSRKSDANVGAPRPSLSRTIQTRSLRWLLPIAANGQVSIDARMTVDFVVDACATLTPGSPRPTASAHRGRQLGRASSVLAGASFRDYTRRRRF